MDIIREQRTFTNNMLSKEILINILLLDYLITDKLRSLQMKNIERTCVSTSWT